MRQDQGDAVSATGSLVDEVDLDVQIGPEMGEGVELVLLCAPVESVGPVGKQPFQVSKIGALLPGDIGRGIRPSRVANPRLEVDEDIVLDLD